MSNINTDSDKEKNKSNKKSSIGPFPIIDFSNAAGSSHTENNEAEKSDQNTGTQSNSSKKMSTKGKDFPKREQSVDSNSQY